MSDLGRGGAQFFSVSEDHGAFIEVCGTYKKTCIVTSQTVNEKKEPNIALKMNPPKHFCIVKKHDMRTHRFKPDNFIRYLPNTSNGRIYVITLYNVVRCYLLMSKLSENRWIRPTMCSGFHCQYASPTTIFLILKGSNSFGRCWIYQ